jgi:hypothetical protein
LSFAVESEESSGRILHVKLLRPRPDNWMLEDSASLTPAAVAQFIRRALDTGWEPSQPGTPFELAEGAGERQSLSLVLKNG